MKLKILQKVFATILIIICILGMTFMIGYTILNW